MVTPQQYDIATTGRGERGTGGTKRKDGKKRKRGRGRKRKGYWKVEG